MYYERENFSASSSLHHILESENVRFPFSNKNERNLGSKIWKIKLQKIALVGNLLDKLRKLYMNGKVLEKFSALLK